jgi:hypothetical protein
LPGVHRSDGPDQLFNFGGFQQVAIGSGLQQGKDILIVIMGG